MHHMSTRLLHRSLTTSSGRQAVLLPPGTHCVCGVRTAKNCEQDSKVGQAAGHGRDSCPNEAELRPSTSIIPLYVTTMYEDGKQAMHESILSLNIHEAGHGLREPAGVRGCRT